MCGETVLLHDILVRGVSGKDEDCGGSGGRSGRQRKQGKNTQ